MSNKIAIVYVGSQAEKKDTVCGTGLVFPRLQPIDVPNELAPKFLRFKDVWVPQDQAQSYVDNQAAKAKQAAELAAQAAELEAQAAEEASLVVDGFGDLGKMTSVQLATIAESEGLAIDKKGAREKLGDYAIRVRDALKANAEG